MTEGKTYVDIDTGKEYVSLSVPTRTFLKPWVKKILPFIIGFIIGFCLEELFNFNKDTIVFSGILSILLLGGYLIFSYLFLYRK